MRRIFHIKTTCFALVFLWTLATNAQNNPESVSNQKNLSYAEFIRKLTDQNLEYAAQKYEVAIADAEVEAAKILPDPEISFTAFDNQERRMKMGYGFEAEVEWELELGGKRKARKNLANEERQLTELELQKYFQGLRKESTLDFLRALKNKMHYEVQKSSYETMLDIARQDSLRYVDGKIKKSTASQSKLEAQSMFGDLQDLADEWQYSLMDIKNLISTEKHDTLFIPVGELKDFDRLFDLEELIQTAQENCTDLKIARQKISVSENQVDLSRAERMIDLGLNVGVENNSFAKNIIGPTPGHTVVYAGVSVPLKFSNNRESGLKTAQYEQEQVKLENRSLEMDLEKEILQAYQHYLSKHKQVKEMKANLKEAESIYDEVKQDYLSDDSESSLLEILYAERTFNNIQRRYIDTLYSYARALVNLEASVGVWDIDF